MRRAFQKFGRGAILRHALDGDSYVVVSDGLVNGEAIGVKHISITNPAEWVVVHDGFDDAAPAVKPCPFCGGAAEADRDGLVNCTTPQCAMDFPNGGVSLNRWNRRA